VKGVGRSRRSDSLTIGGDRLTSASALAARSRYWSWELVGPSAAKPYLAASTRMMFTIVPARASLHEESCSGEDERGSE
jgi:hypothetical protein